MKRMTATITGAAFLVMAFAGTALAQTNAPPPTTVVEGNGGGSGGTAFTGSNVSTFLIVAMVLVVVGLAALFVARRHSIDEA
jgi:opacity protein-like surface antigen